MVALIAGIMAMALIALYFEDHDVSEDPANT